MFSKLQLAGYYQHIRRSLSFEPLTMAFLLGMNFIFRREYLDMRKKHLEDEAEIKNAYGIPLNQAASAEF